ncbi:DUF721 family protein [Williamsia serinedens]|uniref:Nucleic acid-binding protein, contains Zn-ribbon domain (Includes truncated derivatives) n=1 Tax=Williamsia serinedens TaxID=391736 RepID=A0ABT1H2D6_9NOCA|nr:DUF721 family protein [Williamsia serinedens]MCP2159893.1 putative nucleic acid-binding protein, contains Zn-ribbon domain (includes truncated derivatives) [Williamsia serinedens]
MDDDTAHSSGHELARKALEDARAKARAAGKAVGQGRASAPAQRKGRRRWSGARPDGRDPQSLGSVAGAMAKTRGWQSKLGEGQVFAAWDRIVGEDIAAHAQPTDLRDRVLSVSAESTAWATQLRLVQRDILAKIAASVGRDVVVSLRITGPRAPSWRKGTRTVPGRGPRDTYG